MKVAPNFKAYLFKERTYLSYESSVNLAAIGEKFWEYRTELKENEIRLSTVLNKVRYLDKDVTDTDPMIWDRLKSLSCRGFKDYVKKQKDNINVYSENQTDNNSTETMTVNGAGLYLGAKKVKGLNLNEAVRETKNGKRLVAVWVDDDTEARKVRKLLAQYKK